MVYRMEERKYIYSIDPEIYTFGMGVLVLGFKGSPTFSTYKGT